MNKTNRFLYILTAGLLLAASGFSAITIDAVRVENLEKSVLDESFVQAYTALRAGTELADDGALSAAVSQDVDTLRRSGRFSYVRAFIEQDAGRMTLVYSVSPRLRLQAVDVLGAEKIGARKIKKELALEAGDYVDEALVGEKARKLEAFCRKNKFPDAVVAWELVRDEPTGEANLLITVREGSRLLVKRIRFEGDRFLSDSRSSKTKRFFKRLIPGRAPAEQAPELFEARELTKVINQKKTWWITPWFGAYQPEVQDADRAAIRKFYLDRGFLDVQVEAPQVREISNGELELTYPIQEGEMYRLGTIGFEGINLFEPTELEKQLRLGSGQVASRGAIAAAAASVGRYYGNRGYINNRIEPVIETDSATHTADVLFKVREGDLATINEILILGNEKTRDEVMRRELAVYPGEIFHQGKVETSERRLKNLNYFETVSRSTVPAAGAGNAYDLTFNVAEKPMGNFLIGAGFSSVDSLVGFAEMSHGNFDITRWPPVGDGQKMKVRLQAGSERRDLELSFVEPWFLGRKLAFGVDVYNRTADYFSDEYELETFGGRLSLSKPLAPFVRGSLHYSLENFDVSGVSSSAPSEIHAESGSRSKSAVGVTVSRDTRDQFFIPTRGNRTSATFELAGGPLLGDTETYFFELKSSHFWSFWNEHVLNLRGAVRVVDSYGSGDVPIFDRLFLGGPRSLRGFDFRDVSPRSSDAGSDEPIGGNSSYFATVEYTVPLWDKIRGAAFYDIGAVNDSSFNFGTGGINSSYGLGARFDLPGFPLRLDYAFPHITDSGNEDAEARWNFLLGYTF